MTRMSDLIKPLRENLLLDNDTGIRAISINQLNLMNHPNRLNGGRSETIDLKHHPKGKCDKGNSENGIVIRNVFVIHIFNFL